MTEYLFVKEVQFYIPLNRYESHLYMFAVSPIGGRGAPPLVRSDLACFNPWHKMVRVRLQLRSLERVAPIFSVLVGATTSVPPSVSLEYVHIN